MSIGGSSPPLYSWFFRKNQHNWDSYVLLSIFFSVLKTQNKTKNILYIANLFVPLRLELASAFPRHFSKNKALTIISRSQRKSLRNWFLFRKRSNRNAVGGKTSIEKECSYAHIRKSMFIPIWCGHPILCEHRVFILRLPVNAKGKVSAPFFHSFLSPWCKPFW